MTPDNEKEKEISLNDIRIIAENAWRQIKIEKRVVLRTLILGLTTGIALAFGTGEEFKARSRILPYRGTSSGSTGLSSLAGIAGVKLPANGSDQAIAAELYPEVAKSLDFFLALAKTPIAFDNQKTTISLVEYFQTSYKKPIIKTVYEGMLSAPGYLARTAKTKERANKPENITDSSEINVVDNEYLEVVKKLESLVTVTIDRKTSIITIEAKMPNSYAAADLVRATSELLMKRIISYESQKAGDQYSFVKNQHDRVEGRYRDAEQKYARYNDQNREQTSSKQQTERERLLRDYNMSFELYQQLTRELEQAKMKMNQDSPVFTILEKPTVPIKRYKPRRALTLIASLFSALVISMMIIIVRYTMTVNQREG